MRVLCTGGTGFVGSHVLRALVGGGHAVRALCRPESRPLPGIPAGAGAGLVEWSRGDLLDLPSLREAAAGCDAVLHVGADVTQLGSPAARAHQRQVNVEGTGNVIEAALGAGARRLIHTSSVAALGRPSPGTIGDENTPYDWPPGMPYNETKRDSERAALTGGARGLDVVVLSPAFVLGPDDPRRRLSSLLRAVKLGLARIAPPGGLTVCDVRHVAAAHVAALTRGRPGERYVLGGAHLTWRELLAELAVALAAPGPLVTLPEIALRLAVVPLGLLALLGPLDLGISRLTAFGSERFFSSAKAIAELGYEETPPARLVAETVAWYRDSGS